MFCEISPCSTLCSKDIATCMKKKNTLSSICNILCEKNHGCGCLGSLGQSKHWPWHLKSLATQMFVQQLVQASIKATLKLCTTWLLLRENHQWLVDSPHKGPVMWIVFSCHDVMMDPHLSHFPNKNLHHIDGLVQDYIDIYIYSARYIVQCIFRTVHCGMKNDKHLVTYLFLLTHLTLFKYVPLSALV